MGLILYVAMGHGGMWNGEAEQLEETDEDPKEEHEKQREAR